METAEKIARLTPLFAERALIDQQISEILDGELPDDIIEELHAPTEKHAYKKRKTKKTPPPTRKKRAPKSGRPCGCGPRGRHRKDCPEKKTAEKPSKSVKRRKAEQSEKPEAEGKTWKCVNCDAQVKSVEAPEECEKCPGTVFVEKPEWE